VERVSIAVLCIDLSSRQVEHVGNKRIKRAVKANQTHVFNRFDVCILKIVCGNVVETLWLCHMELANHIVSTTFPR